jgi:hypothetical protein
MIQRIQTVFLFLAFLASIALFFFPIAGIYPDTAVYPQLSPYKFYVCGFVNMVPGETSLFSFMTIFPLLLLNIVVGAMSVICIFLYKNRIRQAKIVRLGILLEIVLIVLIFFVYAGIIEKNLHTTPEYMEEAGIYFPLISMVFLILAYRFIIKDEKLVRSADRLR